MTIAEKITKELKSIKPELMYGDSKLCAEHVGRNEATISRYLNGSVRHTDTGLAILNFFKSRIEERKKQLA